MESRITFLKGNGWQRRKIQYDKIDKWRFYLYKSKSNLKRCFEQLKAKEECLGSAHRCGGVCRILFVKFGIDTNVVWRVYAAQKKAKISFFQGPGLPGNPRITRIYRQKVPESHVSLSCQVSSWLDKVKGIN